MEQEFELVKIYVPLDPDGTYITEEWVKIKKYSNNYGNTNRNNKTRNRRTCKRK